MAKKEKGANHGYPDQDLDWTFPAGGGTRGYRIFLTG
jgi:hypothetical protein